MTWQSILIDIGSATISAGGITGIVSYLRARRTAPIDNVVRLSDAAMKQVDNMQERVAEAEQAAFAARQQAEDARQELMEMRRQIGDARRRLQELTERLRRIAIVVHGPNVTLERIRGAVPRPSDIEN